MVLEVEGRNIMYKITDFAPQTSIEKTRSPDASYWPFSKPNAKMLEKDMVEIVMMKDIYNLGTAVLELMIGRTSSQACSISLDSLPLTWAEFPESAPLI